MKKPHYYARGRYVYTNLHGHKCEFKRPEVARQFAKEMNETVDKYWIKLTKGRRYEYWKVLQKYN